MTTTRTFQMARAGANALHIVTEGRMLCTPDQNMVHGRSRLTVSKASFSSLSEIEAAFTSAERPCKRCAAEVTRHK